MSLPGGSDIQAEFYGAMKEAKTDTPKNYLRSMIEFALLYHAHNMKIPTMGTCRGAQMINVYFGGTLKQHVENQWDEYQELQLSESSRKQEIQRLIEGNTFLALSVHHQACYQMGVNLETVLEYKGIPKLFLSRDNLFIGSQFHPEIYMRLAELPSEKALAAANGQKIYRFFFELIHRFSTPKI